MFRIPTKKPSHEARWLQTELDATHPRDPQAAKG